MKILFISSFFLLVSCSHKKEFKKNIKEGNCDEAARHIPSIKKEYLYKQSLKSGVGHLYSYSATAATVAFDTALFATSTVGAITMYCPMFPVFLIALIGGESTKGMRIDCFDRPIIPIKIHTDFYTDEVFDGTRPARCVNLSKLSKSLREVASCYEYSDGLDGLVLTKNNIKELISDEYYFSCLESNERKELVKKYGRLEEILPSSDELEIHVL